MIPLTRPDGTTVLLNPDRVELVEETPDTVVPLAEGRRLLVRETAAEVASRFVAYQRSIRVPETRFGGRRRSDPPEELDPARYEHPHRPGIRVVPRSLGEDAP